VVVDTLILEESHLKFLTVSAELGCKPVALRLQFFPCHPLRLKVLELLLKLYDFWVGILVVFYNLVKLQLFFGHYCLALVAFGFSFATVSLEIVGYKNWFVLVSDLFIFVIIRSNLIIFFRFRSGHFLL